MADPLLHLIDTVHRRKFLCDLVDRQYLTTSGWNVAGQILDECRKGSGLQQLAQGRLDMLIAVAGDGVKFRCVF